MSITSNSDLWEAIDQIRTELVRQGKGAWSERLYDAMYISNVTGEVLGETRLQLRGLYRSKDAAGDGILQLQIQLEFRVR